jgi:mono/diheme cytochrome c family protein
MFQLWTKTLLGAALVMLLAARPAAADAAAGQRLYLQYCSACHGPGAKGDGVVSGFMRPKPPDLTQLAKHNKGTFPTVLVIDTIDGRSMPRAHGDSGMPVWGTILRSDAAGADNSEVNVHSVVTQITDYLRSVQAK